MRRKKLIAKMNRCLPLLLLGILTIFPGFATVVTEVQSFSPVKDQIRIGYSSSFFPGMDKRDVQTALDLWTGDLAKTGPIKAEPVAIIFDNLRKMVEAARQQEVDFVVMPFLDYLKIRQTTNLEPLLLGTKNGRIGEEYVLIVHRSAPWTEVKQLRGKKLLVQGIAGASASSLLWLDTVLLHQGLPLSTKFFHPLKKVDKPSKAVLPIFFKQADACLVPLWAYNTMVELNPQVGSETKILARSPTLPRAALFLRKGVADRKKLAVINRALKLGGSARSKQLMTLFNLDKLVRFHPKYLESIIALYEDHNSFFSKYK
jgi:ABC-type phosphate/phosphonate transport system substrate-binding protein